MRASIYLQPSGDDYILPLGHRWARRALILFIAAICGSYVWSAWRPADVNSDWGRAAGLLSLVLLLVANILLRRATRRVAIAPEEDLDERQEAIRNRAYRLAHRVYVLAFGIPLWLAAFGGSAQHNTWYVPTTDNKVIVLVYLELLLMLPTIIIAWLEPNQILEGPRPTVRQRFAHWYRTATFYESVAWAAVVFLVVLPLLFSVTFLFAGSTQSVARRPNGPETIGLVQPPCDYVEERKEVGWGPTQATIRLAGEVCWDKHGVHRFWGLSTSDCSPASFINASVSMRCTAYHDHRGALHVLYRARVESMILPLLHRDVAITLVVGRQGKVLQFN